MKNDKMSTRDGSSNPPPGSGGRGGTFGNFDDDYPERDEKAWNDPLADEFIRQVRKKNPDDAKLLQAWTGSSGPFNEPAREGKATPEIERLVKIIDSYEVPDNAKMFRAETRDMLVAYRKKKAKFEEGEVVVLGGFTSVSATKKAFQETRKVFELWGSPKMSVEIEFFVPKGTKAIPLSKVSRQLRDGRLKYEFQKEWLLQKDTKVLVLENRKQNGKVFLKLLVLNQREENKK